MFLFQCITRKILSIVKNGRRELWKKKKRNKLRNHFHRRFVIQLVLLLISYRMFYRCNNIVPLLGGVRKTACPRAVNTDCSARPILNLPPKDLNTRNIVKFAAWHIQAYCNKSQSYSYQTSNFIKKEKFYHLKPNSLNSTHSKPPFHILSLKLILSLLKILESILPSISHTSNNQTSFI